ncbi:MAG: hypothetical protein PUP92_26555 [Rhizonema sp. PD38]|nr:hypothetical protein [Rhizonema sp. PD38]
MTPRSFLWSDTFGYGGIAPIAFLNCQSLQALSYSNRIFLVLELTPSH